MATHITQHQSLSLKFNIFPIYSMWLRYYTVMFPWGHTTWLWSVNVITQNRSRKAPFYSIFIVLGENIKLRRSLVIARYVHWLIDERGLNLLTFIANFQRSQKNVSTLLYEQVEGTSSSNSREKMEKQSLWFTSTILRLYSWLLGCLYSDRRGKNPLS